MKFIRVIAASAVFMLLRSGLLAATVWNGGSGNRDWFDDGNWSEGVPGSGMDVVINSGADVLVTNATAVLGDFTMNGGTLTFSNWFTRIEAAEVIINGGTVTLPPPFKDAEMSNRVWFVSSGDFTLGAAAVIDTDGRGYARADGYVNGNGPGYGKPCAYGSGAGHGGRGGAQGNSAKLLGGITYGAAEAPEAPGSGGAPGNNVDYLAGDGGGAVRLVASGKATINGAIKASGVRNGIYAGGGSGGSVYITCQTFAGSGAITANGAGVQNGGGGGGGGRIAVVYAPVAQSNAAPFAVALSAKGAPGLSFYKPKATSDPGTIYLPDAQILSDVMSVAHAGRLVIPGLEKWQAATLTVSAACDLSLPDGVDVTVAGNCQISAGQLDVGWGGNVTIGGDLSLSGSGKLQVRSAATNGVVDHGALLAVAGDITVADTAWLYLASNPTNGGAPLVTCQNLAITGANSGLDADGLGFKGGDSGGSSDGSGPGKGWGSNYGGGAGYGGAGWWGAGSKGWGATYGNAFTNMLPGSGGGSYAEGNGGDGGGLIRVVTSGDILINGIISANGNGGHFYSGGGAGGGIELSCQTITEPGTIRANGGASANSQGSGGGGRIAIHYNPTAQENVTVPAITFSAAGSKATRAADNGTIFFPPLLQSNVNLPHVGKLVIPEPPLWAPDSITVNANCELEYPDDAMINIANDIAIKTGKLAFGGGSTVTIGGNVTVTNSGRLVLRGGPTNDVLNANGLLFDVAGDIDLFENCWIDIFSHKTNGGAPLVKVDNLRIPYANSGINADYRGFLSGHRKQYGNDTKHGLGPGGGKSVDYGSGGGHGGTGGASSQGGAPGQPYAYNNAPGTGSGGGKGASDAVGGNGGGRIRVEAKGTILINGTITANGENSGIYAGGGAGGGIWLIGRKILGTGTFTANGGESTNAGGPGGGGRIAFWKGAPYPPEIYEPLSQDLAAKRVEYVDGFAGFTPSVSVTNGVVGNAPGTPGTVVYINLPPYGGTLLLLQ